MPRNLNRRVEVLFPIEDKRLVRRIRDRILTKYLEDDSGARLMQSDGTYVRATHEPGKKAVSSQLVFMKRQDNC
ncbi:MAG: hypothetical protein JO061_19150, partial [Acidobacteriaceae bacterium]|nr:hypothetical protein [Acidobacteriaceae bacterium]